MVREKAQQLHIPNSHRRQVHHQYAITMQDVPKIWPDTITSLFHNNEPDEPETPDQSPDNFKHIATACGTE